MVEDMWDLGKKEEAEDYVLNINNIYICLWNLRFESTISRQYV